MHNFNRLIGSLVKPQSGSPIASSVQHETRARSVFPDADPWLRIRINIMHIHKTDYGKSLTSSLLALPVCTGGCSCAGLDAGAVVSA